MIDVQRPADKALIDDGVRVWYFSLDAGDQDYPRYERSLNSEERERAGRFRFTEHRRRFVVGRGRLRVILGHYAGCEPQSVRLEYGEHGKPMLSAPAGVKFSVSNSGDMGAVAVASRIELGLDIEQIRPGRDHDLIVSREFSVDERNWYRDLPESRRELAFFELWTCKEAYLKGKGVGLSAGLSRFSVSLHPGAAPRLVWSDIEAGDTRRWRFHRLALAPGYVACLAVDGECGAVDAAPWHDAGPPAPGKGAGGQCIDQ